MKKISIIFCIFICFSEYFSFYALALDSSPADQPVVAGVEGERFSRAIAEAQGELGSGGEEVEAKKDSSLGLSELLGFAALLAALGAMAWLAWVFRGGRFLSRQAGREMRVVDRMQLGRQSALLIVRVRGKDYWVGESGAGITLLSELPGENEGEGTKEKV